jgi:hypothetical protein
MLIGNVYIMIKDDGYDSDGGAIILGGIIKVVIFV